MSQPLLDYVLDDAFDHFGYLGSNFESALPDIRALADDIRQHSEIWDHVCIPARWEIGTQPHWPAARHDLLLYILVAFAPNSFMSAFFRDNALKPKEGTNPLVYAAHFNKDEHARTLLFEGARLCDRGWETSGFRQSLPIEVAFQNRHYAMIAHFVEEGSTVPPQIFTDSFFKCNNKSLDDPYYSPVIPSSIARVLVQTDDFAENMNNHLKEVAWRAMKTSDQLLVFRDATEEDLVSIIRRFIQVADEHFTSKSISEALFRFAIAQGYFSATRYLLTLGTPTPLPSDLLVTLYHYPGKWKTTSMIQFLVDNGADVLVHTSNRDSVLHAILWAPGRDPYSMVDDADEGDILEAVKLVVGYGCDPLEADSRGNTPLRIAVERGHISVARYFHTLGAPLPPDLLVTLNRRGSQSRGATVPMIRFLVENGVNTLSHDSNGDSVLHIALQSFYDENEALEAVKLLVGYGCNPLEANSRGNTPLHIAVQRGHISAVRYLLTLGTAPLPPDLFVTLDGFCQWLGQSRIRFLVENGVNVLANASNGNSLFHTVLQCLYDENEALGAVILLVSYGCNPLEANSRGNTPLHVAVRRGYISVARYFLTLGASLPPDLLVASSRDLLCWSTAPMIRFLVENGVDVFAHSADGASVLHIALQSFGDESVAFEAVKLLVGYGCDPLEADFRGITPLYIAVERGYISVARYLLTRGTPLPPDLLVIAGTAPMIRFLVENGANALSRNSNGDSMLHIALWSSYDDNGSLEAAKLLVSYGCNPLEANSHGNTPLHVAVERGHVSAAQYLLSVGAPLPPDILITLKDYGWDQNRTPMIRFLVENGADVLARASNGDSLLHTALRCLYDDNEVFQAVKLLIGYGCNPLEADSRGDTPLHIAVERGHISVAQYLLTLGAPLHQSLLATVKNYWLGQSMMNFLIENGVDVPACTSNGDSLLHTVLQSLCDENEALEAVKFLVGYGCNPLLANSCGSTPLHISVERGYISVARYLLTLGAPLPPDLLVTLDRGWWATVPMIRFLVENGADVLARTGDGDSLLYTVLKSRSSYDENEALEAIKLLVSYGCNPFEADSHGNTLLHIAVQQGDTYVARYLLTLGAPLPPDLLVTLDCDQSGWSTAPMIHSLVENGVNVFAHSSDGDSVLHLVLRCFNDANETLEAMKVLVGYGCDPLEANFHGNTPLHIAVRQGHISAARYLLTLGAPLPPDLLVTLKGYWLGWSTAYMIPFLVENGVDVLARASNGDSVLDIALQSVYYDHESVEIVRTLVGYGCDPLETNSRGNTPLHVAVARGHTSTSRYLLTLGASLPSDLPVTLNRDRSRWSTAPMIHFLVENGVDIFAHSTEDGDSLLHIALQCFYDDEKEALEAVKVLVGYGCDPIEANFHGHTPLRIAVQRGHISAAQYFITLDAPLPPDFLVILNRDWSYWSTAPMIRFLVENGVDVHAYASDGDSVLHIALRCFNPANDVLDAVKLLVGYGCDPLEANSRGEIPLHIAAERGYVSVARYLITQGACVLTKASNGDTMLHFATSGVNPYDEDDDGGALEAVKFFVGCGCEPTAPNDDGETPLHIAVDLGRIKTINFLLSLNILLPCDILFTAIESDDNSAYRRYIIETLVTSGCDTRTPNSDGDTPLRVAVMKGNVDVVEYLLSVVSEYNPPLEDLLLATALAPPSVQSELRHMLSDRRMRSQNLES